MIFDENVIVFDTSNQYIAAALYRGKQEVQSIIEFMPRGQAERLMSLLNELLKGASLDWPDISKIGVCTGPGNFTGIRIQCISHTFQICRQFRRTIESKTGTKEEEAGRLPET